MSEHDRSHSSSHDWQQTESPRHSHFSAASGPNPAAPVNNYALGAGGQAAGAAGPVGMQWSQVAHLLSLMQAMQQQQQTQPQHQFGPWPTNAAGGMGGTAPMAMMMGLQSAASGSGALQAGPSARQTERQTSNIDVLWDRETRDAWLYNAAGPGMGYQRQSQMLQRQNSMLSEGAMDSLAKTDTADSGTFQASLRSSTSISSGEGERFYYAEADLSPLEPVRTRKRQLRDDDAEEEVKKCSRARAARETSLKFHQYVEGEDADLSLGPGVCAMSARQLP
eukprot:CAMPEP_0206236884 /NCGR_PEP_ID=MMETSP0047_2-20121206/13957_1 /ASSEMBLY_ACC=CAM_ASM_000192 /TAXON_ID=195065 /ORGANISM="Chroomonas mesostigmatica_cf, Strain CCMP1168" /LENGTH=278 /DNA_ID=CAMNT_0053661257 /DNA_START=66 /DNA_END=902 /DNA_ORIENTATION=-